MQVHTSYKKVNNENHLKNIQKLNSDLNLNIDCMYICDILIEIYIDGNKSRILRQLKKNISANRICW